MCNIEMVFMEEGINELYIGESGVDDEIGQGLQVEQSFMSWQFMVQIAVLSC